MRALSAALAEYLKLPFHLKEIDLPQMKSDAGQGQSRSAGARGALSFFCRGG